MYIKSSYLNFTYLRCDRIFLAQPTSSWNSWITVSSEPIEFASVERRKLFPLDRGSRRESTVNNSKLYAFPFLGESINRNEINREKLRLPRLRGVRTVRAGPSWSSSRLSVRKNFRSRVVSCAPGTASFESNFDTRDAISIQRVCKFSRSVDVVQVKERRRAAVWPFLPFFPRLFGS